VFYSEDTVTGRQHSLRTQNEAEASTLLNAKNESFRQPALNLQVARAYLTASDPALVRRTGQDVMEEIRTHGKEETQIRYTRSMKSKVFDGLGNWRIVD
jgi:hypothetical protein